MAHFKEHCNDCRKQLGKDFSYVHLWLDEFFKTAGYMHRTMRHHKEGIEEVRAKWGDEAAKAAEIHILRDFQNEIPTREECEKIMKSIY